MIRYDAKMSSKNQITVPVRVREMLGIGAEDTLTFVIKGDVVSVEPSRMTMADLYQSIPAMKRKPNGGEYTLEEVMDLDREQEFGRNSEPR